MPARGLILLTACSAAALAVLIGLGLWQLQRLQWKEGLIAQIEARVKAEPVSLKEAVAQASAGEDVSYLRVRVEGRFDNAKERYLFAVSDGTPGWHAFGTTRGVSPTSSKTKSCWQRRNAGQGTAHNVWTQPIAR